MGNADHWILRNGKPTAVGVYEWAVWFETHYDERIVEQTTRGDIWISTVFVGVDFSFRQAERPPIYETVVTENGQVVCVCRVATLADAKAVHFDLLSKVEASQMQGLTDQDVVLAYVGHQLCSPSDAAELFCREYWTPGRKPVDIRAVASRELCAEFSVEGGTGTVYRASWDDSRTCYEIKRLG